MTDSRVYVIWIFPPFLFSLPIFILPLSFASSRITGCSIVICVHLLGHSGLVSNRGASRRRRRPVPARRAPPGFGLPASAHACGCACVILDRPHARLYIRHRKHRGSLRAAHSPSRRALVPPPRFIHPSSCIFMKSLFRMTIHRDEQRTMTLWILRASARPQLDGEGRGCCYYWSLQRRRQRGSASLRRIQKNVIDTEPFFVPGSH